MLKKNIRIKLTRMQIQSLDALAIICASLGMEYLRVAR